MIYKGNKLKEIIFPLGGIGTGSIGLAGNGAIVDWEIYNRPNKGSINGYTHFAVKAEYPNGKSVTKVLQGDHIKDLVGQYSKVQFDGYGYGPAKGTMSGYPHFKNIVFDGKFPIATITFTDEYFPAKVILKAFNPFIPLDAFNSSIPAALFEIEIKSLEEGIKYTVMFSTCNPYPQGKNSKVESSKYTAIKLARDDVDATNKDYGELSIAVDDKDGIYQQYWYRGVPWCQDNITTYWRELTDGTMENRVYEGYGVWGDMASIGSCKTISKNTKDTFRFVLSWNIPNNYNYWQPAKDENGEDITWKNYYATQFEDSTASGFYCLDKWNTLYKKTASFCNSLHSSTLDKSVIEAATSTLSVLKSPTVLRLQDGTFYGWEGVHENSGSCQGTCTHVWSYAYALCFLFPELERSLRDTEFNYDTDEFGKMFFRSYIPFGKGVVAENPCVDGQMATVIKIYRDWKITGNTEWLRDNWDNVRKILEYAWSTNNPSEWDRDKDGVLEGKQHHTLDMELFGPSSWLQSMYLAALKAASIMARHLGYEDKAKEYEEVFESGYKWTKENLFNGEYFFQKVDVNSNYYTEHFNCDVYWNSEKKQLKYQIAEGSIIDQMLGQWHSNVCGLGDIFDKEQRKTALMSMMKNNFKPSLREFTNAWRLFALNDEAGTIMCDYPEGKYKPIISIPYTEECMTGFEYSFAGLLISEGYIEDGLKVVKAIRDRYDGEKRNPWNEIECGSNYARAMASFALLPIFSGFEFDLPNKTIGFSPIVDGDFKCFFGLGTAWGDLIRKGNTYKIAVKAGSLDLSQITINKSLNVRKLVIDGKVTEFTQKENIVSFNNEKVKKEIIFEV